GIGPVLLYATAGWAWTGISTVQRTAAGTGVSSSGTVDGVVYGIGAEAYILPPVSIRFEALRYDYGTEKLSVASGVTALSSIDRGDTVVRAGVTLHFKKYAPARPTPPPASVIRLGVFIDPWPKPKHESEHDQNAECNRCPPHDQYSPTIAGRLLFGVIDRRLIIEQDKRVGRGNIWRRRP